VWPLLNQQAFVWAETAKLWPQRIGGLANGVQKFFMLLRKFVIGSAARRAPASQGNGSARSANSACWCR
jgi:hypothetical protein